MASDDLNGLHDALVPVAEMLLKSTGEFLPFGATMSSDGELRLVGAKGETEFPGSQALIDILVGTFYSQANASEIRACGICLDTRFRPSSDAPTTDAICNRLESATGEYLTVYLPYTLSPEPSGTGYVITFGETVANIGTPEIFLKKQS
jgi:hypothetical protein